MKFKKKLYKTLIKLINIIMKLKQYNNGNNDHYNNHDIEQDNYDNNH